MVSVMRSRIAIGKQVSKPALSNKALIDACNPRPLRDRVALAKPVDDDIVTTVVGLGNAGRPHAILRRVRAVIVLPFKAQSGRHLTHVTQEVLKAMPSGPSVTNRNPSSAVPLVRMMARAHATRAHVEPDAVCRRTGTPVSPKTQPR